MHEEINGQELASNPFIYSSCVIALSFVVMYWKKCSGIIGDLKIANQLNLWNIILCRKFDSLAWYRGIKSFSNLVLKFLRALFGTKNYWITRIASEEHTMESMGIHRIE